MSTTFGIILESGIEKPIARRVGGPNGAEMWFTDEMAELLPDDTLVEPLDNSPQGIYTIGDIKNHIKTQEGIKELARLKNEHVITQGELEIVKKQNKDDE